MPAAMLFATRSGAATCYATGNSLRDFPGLGDFIAFRPRLVDFADGASDTRYLRCIARRGSGYPLTQKRYQVYWSHKRTYVPQKPSPLYPRKRTCAVH